MNSESQWLFPLESLRETPSEIPLDEEMLRRQRGVDWLMRVGSTLNMGLGPCLTAATYLHRFYMRRMIEDYHEFEIAATCLFLASKTEENGKRLDDLVTVALAKLHSVNPNEVAGKYDKDASRWEQIILTYEEVLLEVLCFDFDTRYPHTYLADLAAEYELQAQDSNVADVIDCTWSIAHDSYRTPLCILQPPQIIAAACFLFAQCLVDGPSGPSLDERLQESRPTDLEWRYILELTENDTEAISVSLAILCQFYQFYVRKDDRKPDVTPYRLIKPPTLQIELPGLFRPRDALKGPSGGISEALTHSNENTSTLSLPKTTPSTPLRAIGTSPYAAAISTTPLSEHS